ncbi:TetR/AcrR family transcriptional regulator [Microbacterium sp. PRC9]|uniref:TetR/AcrR family transcriptional regulator n=1 Tax=Microbacterium sp. PRC9 TaxID=2962591 RepID=UPI002881E17A|nr:TetR/AcrR family transcriptional regulator [Microbacterium sp. PRC9]MDT0142391.1 TetR/AcrR family transcriptional regulator [Microbacterium sp. PRC9]
MTEERTRRGPYRSGIARRRQIITTAAEVFATYGYRNGSLRQIATAVGVTPAAVTRHFDGKEDLLTGVLQYWREQTDQLRDPDATGLDFFNGLRNLLRYHVDHPGYLELFLTLSTEATDPNHPAAEFIRKRYDDTVSDFGAQLTLAIDAGDARPMSEGEIDQQCRALIAYLDGIELQWLLNPTIDLAAQFGHHLDGVIASWRPVQSIAPR